MDHLLILYELSPWGPTTIKWIQCIFPSWSKHCLYCIFLLGQKPIISNETAVTQGACKNGNWLLPGNNQETGSIPKTNEQKSS